MILKYTIKQENVIAITTYIMFFEELTIHMMLFLFRDLRSDLIKCITFPKNEVLRFEWEYNFDVCISDVVNL